MLEQGPDIYHRPVLRLLYEYLRLQEPLAHRMQGLVNSTIVVVHRHLAGPLWKEAVDLLKLVVASSAALVQPPTRGLPVDLGLIHHTLPGPTLQFKMDLQVLLLLPVQLYQLTVHFTAKFKRSGPGTRVIGAMFMEESSRQPALHKRAAPECHQCLYSHSCTDEQPFGEQVFTAQCG